MRAINATTQAALLAPETFILPLCPQPKNGKPAYLLTGAVHPGPAKINELITRVTAWSKVGGPLVLEPGLTLWDCRGVGTHLVPTRLPGREHKLAKYAQQVVVDERDIVDDSFEAFCRRPTTLAGDPVTHRFGLWKVAACVAAVVAWGGFWWLYASIV